MARGTQERLLRFLPGKGSNVLQPSAPELAADVSADLAQQMASMARLASAGAEGLVIADSQGQCVLLNDLAARFAGCVRADLRDLSISAYLALALKRHRLIDEDGAMAAETLDIAALVAARRSLHFAPSVSDARLSGQERACTLTPYPLRNAADALVGYALFLRDLLPLALDEPLENGLLSSVSHDLRTPLMVIKAAVTGLLQEGLQWDEALRRETLQDINEETDRLNSLVSALLEMSRIQGGALRLQTEWCDLAEIIYAVLDRLQQVTCRHRVMYDVAISLPLIQGDYMQLDRVLCNLIENAVKYSPEGAEIRITVRLLEGDVQVCVLDQGCGVPPEEREQIFEKFYRVKQRRPSPPRPSPGGGLEHGRVGRQATSLAGGSGLGLAICRGIIQAHHGRIWVEDRPEGGSCFSFTLPVEQSAPMTGRAAHESGPFGESVTGLATREQEAGGQFASRIGAFRAEETDAAH